MPKPLPPRELPASEGAEPQAIDAAEPGYTDAPGPGGQRYEFPDRDGDEVDCALGNLCLGPVVNLGVLNPIGFGLHARVGKYVGFGVDYQFLPEISIDRAATSASLFTVDARVYPFGGAFFLSGGFAYQVLNASASAQVTDPLGNDYGMAVDGSVSLPMLKLGTGFFGNEGLVLGIDVAVEIPLAGSNVEFASSSNNLSPEEMAEVEQTERDVEQAAKDVLDMMPVLVQVNLLRLGYVF